MSFYLYLIIAFFLGGIPFGLMAGYLFGQGDVRQKGSGNIGATNVWRVAGPVAGIITFAGDIGKGVAAVLLCGGLYQAGWPVPDAAAALIGGILAVLGHTFSPLLGFRGGKGVNTALGVFITLLPIETLIAVGVFIFAVGVFRYISLGSMAAAVSFALVMWIERMVLRVPVDDLYLAAATVVAFLILLTHRQNIKRLMAGTENRFQLRRASQ